MTRAPKTTGRSGVNDMPVEDRPVPFRVRSGAVYAT